MVICWRGFVAGESSQTVSPEGREVARLTHDGAVSAVGSARTASSSPPPATTRLARLELHPRGHALGMAAICHLGSGAFTSAICPGSSLAKAGPPHLTERNGVQGPLFVLLSGA